MLIIWVVLMWLTVAPDAWAAEKVAYSPETSGAAVQLSAVPPRQEWTENERWAWGQIAKGEAVDFDQHWGVVLNPRRSAEWTSYEKRRRLLSSGFLRAVLVPGPWKMALHGRGVEIRGAYFAEVVNLAKIDSIPDLMLDNSYLEKGLWAQDLKTEGLLTVEDSCVGGLCLERFQGASSLFLGRSLVLGEISLRGSQVKGQLSLEGTEVLGSLKMEGLRVNQDMSMRSGHFKGVSTLREAKVEGQLIMEEAIFDKPLCMDKVSVGSDLFLRGINATPGLELAFSHVGGNLNLKGAQLGSLNLTGSQVGGIICRQEDWPQKIKLHRLTYGYLGSMDENIPADNMTAWPADSIVNWLGRQEKYHSQPYEQCVKVLREAGQAEKADEVLFASRERERDEAKKNGNWGRYVHMSLQRWILGYNLTAMGHVLSLMWAALLVLAGAAVSHSVKRKEDTSVAESMEFSMRRLFRTEYKDHPCDELTGWQRWYFILHQVLGWALALFITAGITGFLK